MGRIVAVIVVDITTAAIVVAKMIAVVRVDAAAKATGVVAGVATEANPAAFVFQILDP